MPSTFTENTGIELIADGEQSGLWGQTTNDNFDIIDRALNGSVNISLSGTTHTLTTASGVLSDGQFAVLVFTGTPSGTNTVTIEPNTAQKTYFVTNSTAQTVVLSQGTGANVSVPAGLSKIVFTNGAGAGAAVFDITNSLSGTFTGNVTGDLTGNVTINGGTIDGTVIGGSTPAAISGTTASFSGDVSIADKIVHAGDTNTQIRFPAADTVTVETNGAERLRVTSVGNVGIGTNSPAAKFDVSTGSDTDQGDISIFLGGTVANTRRASLTKTANANGDLTVTAGVGTGGSSGLVFKSNDTSERMRITSGGFVGIGTSSPRKALEVSGAIQSKSTADETTFVRMFADSVSQPVININTGGALRFAHSAENFTSFVERMRITSTGNVGIGTTSPADKLTVSGNVFAEGSSSKFIVSSTGSAANSPSFTFSGQQASTGMFLPSNATLAFSTAGSERLRITSTGNVGIGLSNPVERLSVLGDFRANSGADISKTIVGGSSVAGGTAIHVAKTLTVGHGTTGQVLLTISGVNVNSVAQVWEVTINTQSLGANQSRRQRSQKIAFMVTTASGNVPVVDIISGGGFAEIVSSFPGGGDRDPGPMSLAVSVVSNEVVVTANVTNTASSGSNILNVFAVGTGRRIDPANVN